jgi:hypothetical protein
MKTSRLINQCLFVCLIAATVLFQVACSKDSKGGNNPAPTVTYYLQNGSCYSSTGQPVAYNYCSHLTGGTGGYYINPSNGQCYSSTGQPVQLTYCQQTGGTGGYYINPSNGQCYSSNGQPVQLTFCQQTGGMGGQACYGTYYYFDRQRNQWLSGQCNGADCRGYTLINAQGQTVTCQ